MVLVDDAHGFGVLGKDGSGTLAHFGLEGENIIQMGTLSKAIGALGGYIAGSRSLIELLINRARGSHLHNRTSTRDVGCCRMQPLMLYDLNPNYGETLILTCKNASKQR